MPQTPARRVAEIPVSPLTEAGLDPAVPPSPQALRKMRAEVEAELNWTFDDAPAAEGTTGTKGKLPIKEIVGGTTLAVVALASVAALRMTHRGPAAAEARPSRPPLAAAVAPAEAAGRVVGLNYLSFGVAKTQADADALAFTLWTHRVDVTVEPGLPGTDGWCVLGTAGFEPGEEDEAVVSQRAIAQQLGLDATPRAWGE